MEYFRIKYITDDGPFVRIKSDNPPMPPAEPTLQFIMVDSEGEITAQVFDIDEISIIHCGNILLDYNTDSEFIMVI